MCSLSFVGYMPSFFSCHKFLMHMQDITVPICIADTQNKTLYVYPTTGVDLENLVKACFKIVKSKINTNLISQQFNIHEINHILFTFNSVEIDISKHSVVSQIIKYYYTEYQKLHQTSMVMTTFEN